MTPRACPAWGWGRSVPLLHSIRTAVSASRESALMRVSQRRNDLPACPAWGGVEVFLCSTRFEPPSVPRVRVPSCAFRSAEMTSQPVQHGGGVEVFLCSTRFEPPSVPRVRARCGGQLFAAKLGSALFHASGVRSVAGGSSYPEAAPAPLDGCNGVRTRSLKPRPVAVSNRPTVTPLSRAQLLHQVQTRRIRHHPPVNSNSPSTG